MRGLLDGNIAEFWVAKHGVGNGMGNVRMCVNLDVCLYGCVATLIRVKIALG